MTQISVSEDRLDRIEQKLDQGSTDLHGLSIALTPYLWVTKSCTIVFLLITKLLNGL